MISPARTLQDRPRSRAPRRDRSISMEADMTRLLIVAGFALATMGTQACAQSLPIQNLIGIQLDLLEMCQGMRADDPRFRRRLQCEPEGHRASEHARLLRRQTLSLGEMRKAKGRRFALRAFVPSSRFRDLTIRRAARLIGRQPRTKSPLTGDEWRRRWLSRQEVRCALPFWRSA